MKRQLFLLLILLLPLTVFAQSDAQRFTGVNPAPFNENAGRQQVDRQDMGRAGLNPNLGGQMRSLKDYSTAGVGAALDEIPQVFAWAAGQWIDPITRVAKALFFILASIEIVWAGIIWVLSREQTGSIMSTLFRKMFILMFFYWVLLNGFPLMINMINNFFVHTAADVGGLAFKNLSPAGVAMVGVNAFTATMGASFGLDLKLFIAMFFIMLIVLLAFFMMAAQLIIAIIEAYIMLSAGLLFLGFAGSNFTKTYAEKYLGLAFGTGVKLFFTYLIVGLGYAITSGWVSDFKAMAEASSQSHSALNTVGRFVVNNGILGYFFKTDGGLNENMMMLGGVVMLAVSLILAYLSMTIPKRAESLMSGGPNMGLGETIGAGAGVVGAMSAAGGAAAGAVAGSTLARGITSTAGAAATGGASVLAQAGSAIKNAFTGGGGPVPAPTLTSSTTSNPDIVPPPGGGSGPTGGNGPTGGSGPTGETGGTGPTGGSGPSGQPGGTGTTGGNGQPGGSGQSVPTPTGSEPQSGGSGSGQPSGGTGTTGGSGQSAGSGPTGGNDQTDGNKQPVETGQTPTGTTQNQDSVQPGQTDSTASARTETGTTETARTGQTDSTSGVRSETSSTVSTSSTTPPTDTTSNARTDTAPTPTDSTPNTGPASQTARVEDSTGSAKVQDARTERGRTRLTGLNVDDRHTVSGEGLRVDHGDDLKTGD
jgi:type IV secretion system protein TrbL